MNYVELGQTGLVVSELCFGGLTLGPLQADLPAEVGGEIIAYALNKGINFIDTAELYGTYHHIRNGLAHAKSKPVIASKSYAYDRRGMINSVEKARREMNVDVVDIFLLHERENLEQIKGHWDALMQLWDYKERGIIKAVGISSHYANAVAAAALMPEIDVIHPLINHAGVGIMGGSLEEMQAAIQLAWENGKGIYAMKIFGGGLLAADTRKCVDYFKSQKYLHSAAVGMRSRQEVDANIALFEGRTIPQDTLDGLVACQRRLIVADWCQLCGKCIERCGQGALSMGRGEVEIAREKCILCGYCARECPEFAIRIL